VSSKAFREIEQLEKTREIKIVTGGLGSFKKPKVSSFYAQILYAMFYYYIVEILIRV
jgi:hypothetical protein